MSVFVQVNSGDLTGLSQEQSLHALRCRRNMRWGPRRKAGVPGAAGGPTGTTVTTDCVDSGTQTDISFQHMVTLGRPVHHNRPRVTSFPSTAAHARALPLQPAVSVALRTDVGCHC